MLEAETAATERKKRVKKYFTPSPAISVGRYGVALLALGLLALAVAVPVFFSGGFLPRAMALILVATGVTVGFRGLEMKLRYDERLAAAEPKPTDTEMDHLLAQDLRAARERALKRLDLTADQIQLQGEQPDPVAELSGDSLAARRDGVPLVVYGPGWLKTWPARTSYAVIAGDGYWRFQEHEIMVICPTDRHLALYVCSIDFLTGTITFEETYEYHYIDIVAVRTTTVSDEDVDVRYVDRKHADEVHFARKLRRRFEIIVSGDRAAVSVGILDENHPEHEELVQRVSIDAVVSKVRKLLRDKKQGASEPTPIVGGAAL